MVKRIITAVVGISAMIAVIWFYNTLALPIVFGILALIGVYEMLGCIGLRKNVVVSTLMYLLTVGSVVFTQFAENRAVYLSVYVSFIFLVLLGLLTVAVFSNGKVPFERSCVAFTSCSFVVTGFISMILIAGMERHGQYLLIMCFLIPWISDTFALFGGMLLGKHKLIPSVSPKKTIEGAISGVLFATIITALYGLFAKNVFTKAVFPIWVFAVLGFLVSIASQIGDLIFSLIKRRYEIKDYGWLFPGHGGILDRFDSVIATTPLLLILCVFYNAAVSYGWFGK